MQVDSGQGPSKQLPSTEAHELGTATVNPGAAAKAAEVQAAGPPIRAGNLVMAVRQNPEAVVLGYAKEIDLSNVRVDDLIAHSSISDRLTRLEAQIRQASSLAKKALFSPMAASSEGVTAAFHGGEGLGKTLAAKVLAKRTGRRLFAANYAEICHATAHKTMQRLEALLAATAKIGGILLFEDAEVLLKDRHPRDGVITDDALMLSTWFQQAIKEQTGVVLLECPQKLEQSAYAGCDLMIAFGFPEQPQRAEIWKRAFAPGIAVDDQVDPLALARLNLVGGQIAIIAKNAAAVAAEGNRAVTLHDLFVATGDEYMKSSRSMSSDEMAVFGVGK